MVTGLGLPDHGRAGLCRAPWTHKTHTGEGSRTSGVALGTVRCGGWQPAQQPFGHTPHLPVFPSLPLVSPRPAPSLSLTRAFSPVHPPHSALYCGPWQHAESRGFRLPTSRRRHKSGARPGASLLSVHACTDRPTRPLQSARALPRHHQHPITEVCRRERGPNPLRTHALPTRKSSALSLKSHSTSHPRHALLRPPKPKPTR